MNSKLTGWDDTIVALATPPGVGAIGVIRISGESAIKIANDLFPSKDLYAQPSHTLHVGYIKEDEQIIDEVVISIFKNPTSYTGEDVVEISCHGSPFIHQQVIDACVERGARLARPGEFTQRAFLNGKLDLTQAEAVADIIASNTIASKNAAINNMRGGFSALLKELREQLLQFSSLIELELDFSEEDVEFADRSQFIRLIEQISASIKKLLTSFKLGNVIKNGVSVAIIGKPNAGKSTLLNALLNDDRAIVSDIPGTTRDTIEEVVNMGGILFRLIDTAGIRAHTADMIENAGIEKSLMKMRQADLVLYLFDVNELNEADVKAVATEFESKRINYILVGNKAEELIADERYSFVSGIVFISARNGLHLDILKQKMVENILQEGAPSENVIVTNARHYHALAEVYHSLIDVSTGLQAQISGDLLSLDIRKCLQYLGEITGEITNEDQLDYIFSKFCIGK